MTPEMDQAAGVTTDGPKMTREKHKPPLASVPSVFSTACYRPEPGRSMFTAVVRHRECGREHLHRTPTVKPFLRRPHCGSGRYVVVPVLPAVEFGRDYDDLDHWADEDGVVRDGHGSPVAPRNAA